MPREVDLNIKLPPGWTMARLAERLDISKGTLRAYMRNRWTVLDRAVFEQLADILRCEAGSLIVTTESSFFEPFRTLSGKEKYPSRPTCLYLRRPDADTPQEGRPMTVGYRDERALDRVDQLLRNCVQRVIGLRDTTTTREQFDERLLQNCIVVGSPIVNPASEMALCHIFGVEPFNPSQREKLPFRFMTVAEPPTPSSTRETSSDGIPGIWLRDEERLLPADSWPIDEFQSMQIDEGRDCAVIVVANHNPASHPQHSRKLIVLGGFSGVGTEAAAKALVDHYRDLEPRGRETYVWGAIEVAYRKDPDSVTRELLPYKWHCRIGGRCPLE
jgi:transcriptional regulator with XRE-family HTH domain